MRRGLAGVLAGVLGGDKSGRLGVGTAPRCDRVKTAAG